MAAHKRLPSNTHLRAIALVRDSMPRRDYREFPEEAARVMRRSAAERAIAYAAVEDATDEAIRLVEKLESSDGIVVMVTDEQDARSMRHHLRQVEQALGDDGR